MSVFGPLPPVIEGETVACMATFPPRYEKLPPVLESLAPQFDRVLVYVNETLEGFPDVSHLAGVTVLDSNEYAGNLSANGKIYPLRWLRSCLVFTVDDDFVYPPDYVARYKEVFDAFDNRCCVTTHGSIFPPKLRWYYERLQTFPAMRALDVLQLVTLAGSGTFAFHQDTLEIDPDSLLEQVMVDLNLSLAARYQGLPIWSVPRPEYWLRHVGGEGLWEQFRGKITHHTTEARQHDWSFECYRKTALEALEALERKQAAGQARGVSIAPELVEALQSGALPTTWQASVRNFMMRVRYLDLLNEAAHARS